MSFHYGLGGTITIAERLPHVDAGFGGAITVAAGALLLIKRDGELVAQRVFVKQGSSLVDADAAGPVLLDITIFGPLAGATGRTSPSSTTGRVTPRQTVGAT